MIRGGILTVSDKGARGERQDESGTEDQAMPCFYRHPVGEVRDCP